jgi:hypothetical protein
MSGVDIPPSLVTHHRNLTLQEKPMKTLRKLTATAVLLLALALPAFAGDMHAPVAPPPPPQSDLISEDATLNSETADLYPLTEATLLMLQSVLALF